MLSDMFIRNVYCTKTTSHYEVLPLSLPHPLTSYIFFFVIMIKLTSVAEPEPQGAASFGGSRSRNAMRLRL
jgi:hypothetical protein